jgi:hypothetical protein
MCPTRIEDAVLVERHRQAHRHAADELRAGGARVDDPPDVEDAEEADDADLTGAIVDVDLGELGPDGVHREMLLVGVGWRLGVGLVAELGVGPELVMEGVGGGDDGRSPRRDPG